MKILIADDHPVVLQGIHSFLDNKKHRVISSCSNGIEAWNNIAGLDPDVAILDHNMPGMNGVEIAAKVRAEHLRTRVILLTMHKEKVLLDKAVATGVMGYLLKDFALDELEQCLDNVANGISYYSKQLTKHITITDGADTSAYMDLLTPAEQKILKVIATQKTSQEIADMLFISVKTVEKHRSNIIRKLDLPHSTSSLAVWAAKNMK
ncbi:DNA-binding response regulator [Flavipsychrobacter stenotrophus]|uniref:DNA-binding response regulator n=1 Tax=Flavipsychrobacter stenotrophus TaxID=2077091 RepID=A0A2S7SPL4_9BACT|nr:response regulator transcription factor [Flavipsychrobacter stenotrophus]PQJ08843.1 DNA-binding response regulator [Flavipsychrobacter stenotrophus]